MQIQERYEPYSQRSYKPGKMRIGNIYRVLHGLQGNLCEYCNAIGHGYCSFNIVLVEGPEYIRKWKLREVNLSKFTQLISEEIKLEVGSSV